MSNEIITASESNIYVDRTTTWNAIGENVSDCKDLSHVLAASGLDYDVVKMPVQLADGTVIPNRFATVRPEGDGLHTYDIVSDKFEVVQNRDAFDFVNYMGEDLMFEKAGETASGMVYIIGKLPEVSILGDAFTPHVIFRNGFSGKVQITAAICPLRLVCQNQFAMAFKDTSNTVGIRHVANAETKLEEAREVLRSSADFMQRLNAEAERLAATHLSVRQLNRVLEAMFPMGEDPEALNSYARHQLEMKRQRLVAAYEADDNANFRGTAWGLVNAYTDFITHMEPAGKKETRFENKFINTTCKPFANNVISVMNSMGLLQAA